MGILDSLVLYECVGAGGGAGVREGLVWDNGVSLISQPRGPVTAVQQWTYPKQSHNHMPIFADKLTLLHCMTISFP